MECGIKLSGYNDIKEGDLLEVYKVDDLNGTVGGTSPANSR